MNGWVVTQYRYRIELGIHEHYVWAKDEDEARDKAIDWFVDTVSVTELDEVKKEWVDD